MNRGKSTIRYLAYMAFSLSLLASLVGVPGSVKAQVPAGLSEYYISGSEEQMWAIFSDMDPYNLDIDEGMHAVISITATSDNTVVYYDHWEDGYDFDISDPDTADATYYLDLGEVQIFESANIPVNSRGTEEYYDGRDRLYLVGGMAQVSRASWPESASTLFAQAWEIFPTRPYQNHYTLPVGENLADSPTNYTDFANSYVIVQSTADNNSVVIEDPLTSDSPDVSADLDRGEVTELFHINSGTIISATYPVQAQIIVGNNYGGTRHYESRDFTVVPTNLWDTAYYSPVGGFGSYNTELYIYNPYTSSLTIDYEDSLGSGSFIVPANSTLSYTDSSGHTIPQNSGVYLSSSLNFWAVGTAASESPDYDWGFSLVPEFTLTSEFFIGWAPGTSEQNPTANGSPVFVTPTEDYTTIFVDFSPIDGVVDATYQLNRLEIQKIFDPDNVNTGMHIWATAPLVVAWGEDPDTAGLAYPYLDMGNTILPLQNDWIEALFMLDKSVYPDIVPAGPGQQVVFTLTVSSFNDSVSEVDITDSLPADWSYVWDSTTITFPDGSTIDGASANPNITGQDLLWDLNQNMNPNETLTVVFSAETTASTSAGFSLNTAHATGSYNSRLLTTMDSATVRVSSLSMRKYSSAEGNSVNPGDTVTYTIVITNAGSAPVSQIEISDPLPAGLTYESGSTMVYAPDWQSAGTFRDDFNTIAFDGSNGTLTWDTDWLEIGESDGAGSGDVRVLNDQSDYQLRVRDNNNGGEGVMRQMDIASFGFVRLSFDYRRSGLDSTSDYVSVSISGDGGGSWTELDRFRGPNNDSAYVSTQYEIESNLATNSRVRFLGSPNLGGTDQVYFDNVQLEAISRVVSDNPGNDPPNLVAAADDYTLLPNESMTVTFRVTLDDPLPPNTNVVVNTAYVTCNTHQNQPLQDTVSDQVGDPTAVSLASFRANSLGGMQEWQLLAAGVLAITGWATAIRSRYLRRKKYPPYGR